MVLATLGLVGCGQLPKHPEPAIRGTACYSCHGDRYLATSNPDHLAIGFSKQCETCHVTTAWYPAEVGDHGFWPLTGAHQLASCAACHEVGRFTDTPRDCAGCHQTNFLGTTNPNHVARAFASTCEDCHSTAAWRPAELDHDQLWPLVGPHAAASCEACHTGGIYANTPRECEGCHLQAYQTSTEPNHVALALPTTCGTCHTAMAWRPANFTIHDHYWPLTDKHASVTCAACHVDGVFADTPKACEGCHLPAYETSTNPDHQALELPTACGGCHTAAGWRPAGFSAHDQYWPIEGQHEAVLCESCHVDAVFTGTPRACEGCHLADYQATTNPDHTLLGLETACGGCHTAKAWRPAGLAAHDQFWAIEGQHKTVGCEACHANSVFSDTPRACEGCHLPQYDASTDPDHAALELSTACAACHTAEAWAPAGFDAHDAFWSLDGQHTEVDCESCHTSSVFSGTPQRCDECHLPAYETSTDPPHAASGFPKNCEACHDAWGWAPATFDHDTTWPLLGKHLATPCESCHADGVYADTPRACEGCHLPDYEATTEPNHRALNLPEECAGCHTAAAWRPAGFTAHDQFWPLTGRHATASCESCHTGSIFAGTAKTCDGCHLPDYQASARPAHVAAGYPKTCETCHTTSGWAPAPFDHGRFWPLDGQHATTTCVSCHARGVFRTVSSSGAPRMSLPDRR